MKYQLLSLAGNIVLLVWLIYLWVKLFHCKEGQTVSAIQYATLIIVMSRTTKSKD